MSNKLGELPLHFPHRNKFGVLDLLERRLLVDRLALILALVLRHHLRKTKTRFGRKKQGIEGTMELGFRLRLGNFLPQRQVKPTVTEQLSLYKVNTRPTYAVAKGRPFKVTVKAIITREEQRSVHTTTAINPFTRKLLRK
jgi:hypothetical protein